MKSASTFFSTPCALWALYFCLCGCRGNAGESADKAPQPYVETVPGSRVTFTMRPVGVRDSADARPRTLWFAETETTWDAYDVFYMRLDEQAGGAGVYVDGAGPAKPDAITRPTLPYSPPDLGWGHGGYPAIGVTFHAAQKYCEWLTAKTGRRYRLPTAEEWVFAANEGDCGDAVAYPPVIAQAWFAHNAGGTTHPVAKRAASCYGLYDMFGNVAEWCIDRDGRPVAHGDSFLGQWTMMTAADYKRLLQGQRQTREWNANDPSLPKSKWWLRDAPFVGFRVVCEEPPG